ncbi:hypothetical protein [Trichocoleus sp. FACHB-90]|nr:hypothetical protein [Trichocoleus sp. FACHB-90]
MIKGKRLERDTLAVYDTQHDFSVPFNCDRSITVRSLSCNHTK